MTSEANRAVASNEPLSIEQLAVAGAKRKRGRPRKYEYTINELPQMAQPIQSIPPLHSTLDGSNIRHDGLQINHTSGGSVAPKMRTIHVLPAHQAQGDKSSRPRDSAKLVKTYENPASNYSSAHVQGNSGMNVVGKHFIGKMTKKIPGFSLITVKVKDNQVLKGWVLDENNLRPITPKNDLAPEFPMLRPSQVQKRASASHMQAAPHLPVRLEDVTLAKPLQMRKPVEKSVAMHTIPPTARPYISSGVVAAMPISVTSGNAEPRPLPKQDTESVNPEPSAAAVPVKSTQSVLISCKQVAIQDALVEGKSVTEVDKDSESSNGSKESSVKAEKLNTTLVDVVVKESPGERKLLDVPVTDVVKESSGQIQCVDSTVMDEIKRASGPREQSNAVNSKHQIFKELSENTEQSGQPKTETDILKGVDGSKSGALGTALIAEASSATHKPLDDVQSLRDEHGMKVDSK